MGKKALLLGAGGPLGALEAGALMAFDDNNVKFDIISGACIGSIIALAYVSPAGNRTGKEGLKLWLEATPVADEIYKAFPINYKVFQKDGSIFNKYWDAIYPYLFSNPFLTENPQNEFERIYNDSYIMMVHSMAPSTTNFFSWNMSRITENEINSAIDFERLKTVKQDVYINALNITKKHIQLFDKTQITAQHVVAGSSLFYLAKPQEIDGEFFGEGSYVDSLNFKGLLQKHEDIDKIVVMNILNKDVLIRTPRNIYDAYLLSVFLPFVTIAEDDIKLFELKHKKPGQKLLKAKFDIPAEMGPTCLDWSYSNFKRLSEIGYKAGEKLVQEFGADLL